MKTLAELKREYKLIVRGSAEHRTVALKAVTGAKRVLPLFERVHPDDDRPRLAIEALWAWARGKRELGMAVVRKLSLDAHAAARGAKTDAATFAARAAGQAVATWHVPTHALAVPIYAEKAVLANKPVKRKKPVSRARGR